MWKIPYLDEEIKNRSRANSIPFIALTETWLKPYVQDAQLHIQDYNIFRCDRSTRAGGGVLLYAHQDLPITNVSTFDDKTCQLLMCTCETSKMIICVLYRPPEASTTSLQSCLNNIQEYLLGKDDFEICLLGDFNFPNISWDPVSSCSSDSAERFISFMGDNFLSQYVLQPTRKNNILDLFVTNSASLVTHVASSDTQLSDHRLVEIYFSYNPCQPSCSSPPIYEPASYRSLDFHRADFDGINRALHDIDWNDLAETCNDEEFPEIFSQTLLQTCMSNCPLKAPPQRKGSRTMRILSRKKRKLQNKYDELMKTPHTPQSQLESLDRKIAMVHYDIREAIRSEHRFREEQAVSKVKCNPKYFYSYAKRFSKKKQTISMLFDNSNNVHTDPSKIANIFQRQFTSVFSDPTKTDVSAMDFDVPHVNDVHEDLQFTKADIVEAIDEIRADASPGPDGIPACLLKNCKEALSYPIHIIWSQSFTSGTVPSCYKLSYISPLHKGGSHALPSNYRPVSLTSHIIKIFERVVRKHLVSYLESNKLLCKEQHGFRAQHSCLTQLLHHFDDVHENYMNGDDTDCIYLDYAKAFDKVDHGLLIRKLHKYGVNSKVTKWIESFLTQRIQQVVVDGSKSQTAPIISGVPQGTVLGPVLFLVFINDITQCIVDSTIRCFADDTRISKAIRREHDVTVLQDDLNRVINWSVKNKMSLHEDKFQYMHHSATRSNLLQELPFVSELFQYMTPGGCTLTPTSQLRDLGVTVSQDLSWSPHIRTISEKARQKAAWVLSVFHTRSSTIMLTLYKSMVRSLLEFCSPLWHPTKIGDIQEIESVQRSFTRRVAGCQDLDYWQRLKKLSLMSLQRRRERFIVLHIWRILHGLVSNDLQIQFKDSSRTGKFAIVPPMCRVSSMRHQTQYDNSLAVKGPRLWNAIPGHLTTIDDFQEFKSKLTTLLLVLPDTPPVRGYSPANTNSLLDWRVDSSVSALWGGRRR